MYPEIEFDILPPHLRNPFLKSGIYSQFTFQILFSEIFNSGFLDPISRNQRIRVFNYNELVADEENKRCIYCEDKWCLGHKCEDPYLILFNPYDRDDDNIEEQEERVEEEELVLTNAECCVDQKGEVDSVNILVEVPVFEGFKVCDGKREREQEEVEVPAFDVLTMFVEKSGNEPGQSFIHSREIFDISSTGQLKQVEVLSPLHISDYDFVTNGGKIDCSGFDPLGIEHNIVTDVFGFSSRYEENCIPYYVFKYKRQLEYTSRTRNTIWKDMMHCINELHYVTRRFVFDRGKILNTRLVNARRISDVLWHDGTIGKQIDSSSWVSRYNFHALLFGDIFTFPEQFVCRAIASNCCDLGIVRSVNIIEHTTQVRWLKKATENNEASDEEIFSISNRIDNLQSIYTFDISKSYRPVKCKTSCNRDSDNKVCTYQRTYAKLSSSSGVLGKDTIYFGNESELSPQRAIFGCENIETGSLYSQHADGIMGLERGDISIVDQLVDKGVISNSFSLCYDGLDDGGGAMVLGSISSPEDMIFTHSDPNRSLYYNMELNEIHVAGPKLPLSPTIFDGKYGIVLDSGTTYAYLPKAACIAFKDAILKELHSLKQIPCPDPSYDDNCFLGAGSDVLNLSKTFPTVDMVFGSNQKLSSSPENYLSSARGKLKDYYNEDILHLAAALYSSPPVYEAFIPLIEMLFLGSYYDQALDVVEEFAYSSRTILPLRTKAEGNLLMCTLPMATFHSSLFATGIFLNEDPTCGLYFSELISLHQRGRWCKYWYTFFRRHLEDKVCFKGVRICNIPEGYNCYILRLKNVIERGIKYVDYIVIFRDRAVGLYTCSNEIQREEKNKQ